MRVIKRNKHPKNLALRAPTPPYPPIPPRANPWEVVPLPPPTHAPEMKTPAPSLRGTLAKGGQSPRRFYPPPNCSINSRPRSAILIKKERERGREKREERERER